MDEAEKPAERQRYSIGDYVREKSTGQIYTIVMLEDYGNRLMCQAVLTKMLSHREIEPAPTDEAAT